MLFLRFLSRLPFPVLYFISDFLTVVAFYLVRYRRNMVQKNLAASFPDKSQEELRIIEKDFYKNLCDSAVETIKLLTISKEELKRRMTYENVSVFEEYKSQNQTVMIMASHTFNWEWLLASGTLELPVSVDFVYQPLNSKFANAFSLATRTRFGAYPIQRREVARECFRRRHLLRAVSIVADQYPGISVDKKYLTHFLNQETAFFYGAAQLAVAMQYAVVYCEIRKVKRGYYVNRFVKVSDPPYDSDADKIIEKYANVVEQLIREQPSGWLWSHNRWKKRHLKKTARIAN